MPKIIQMAMPMPTEETICMGLRTGEEAQDQSNEEADTCP